jgi:tetratricopeptide (TPR) repeat protein
MSRFAWSMSVVVLIASMASARADDAATCRSAGGDPAIAACNRAIAGGRVKDRELAGLRNKRGFELERKGDLDGAFADYNEAIRLDPKFAAALHNRGSIYRKKRDLDRAVADNSEAIRINPKYALAYSGRGLALVDKSDFDAALADLNIAIRLDPGLPVAYSNRGLAYRGKNDFVHALADYDEAIRLDPKNAIWYYNRGLAWRAKGDIEHAIADFDDVIRLDARFVAAYRERGLAYGRKGDSDLAIADFSEAIRLGPNNASAYVDRGRAYAAGGDYEHAAADAQQAIQLSPNGATAHNLRGFALKQMDESDRALAALDEAVRLAPNLAVAHANRGDVYRRKGDFDRAIADLSEAIRLDPTITAAYTNRGLAYEAKGDIAHARTDFAAAADRPVTRSIIARGAIEVALARLAALGFAAPEAKLGAASSGLAAGLAACLAAGANASPANPSATALAERRIALVIGNSAYRSAPPLPNARRDADAIATALRGVGFQTVTLEGDLPKEKLSEALREFARLAEKADWALIYYGGHGIEMNGVNYLIPVDAKLETDRDVQFEALPLEQVMSAVEGARKLRIILLDACRENPFARQMRRTVATRSIGRGLAAVEPEGGTLVAYAAKHGEVALDGDGKNSPFVSAFIKHIATPGVEINKLFRLVRDDVLAATSRKQEPFVYGSLPGEDFFFSPPVAKNGR